MALSVLVVLLLAILYEGIKVGKAKLLYQALASLSTPLNQQLILETDRDSASSDVPPAGRTRLRYGRHAWVMGRGLRFTLRGRWATESSNLISERKWKGQGIMEQLVIKMTLSHNLLAPGTSSWELRIATGSVIFRTARSLTRHRMVTQYSPSLTRLP